MKISLIQAKPNKVHFFSNWKMPLLGTALLATYLKENGHEVKCFCENIININKEFIKNSDVICFTVLTPTVNRVKYLSNTLRKLNKKAKIILGGPHVTFVPEELKEYCDYIFIGESEKEFLKLINNNFNIKNVNNLYYKLNNKLLFSNISDEHNNYSINKIIDWNLVPGYKASQRLLISTSRGCPHNCIYCSVTKMYGKKYRYCNENKIYQEIEKYKPKHIFFIDDNFTVNKKRIKNLLENFIKKRYKFTWDTQAKLDLAKDEKMLDLMKKSGCTFVHIGFESVNNNTLKYYKKAQNVKDIENCINSLHRKGISIHGMFVLGADTDDINTFSDTLQFALKNKIEVATFFILTPFPGTELFNFFLKQGRIIHKNWDYYNGHHCVYKPNNFSSEELEDAVKNICMKFVSLPEIFKLLFTFNFKCAFYRYLNRISFKKLFTN